MSSSFTDNCVNLMRTEAGVLVCTDLNKKAKYCGPGSSCPFYKSKIQDRRPVKMGDKCHKESKFIGYRDKDGYLVLPTDWDE